MRAIIPKVTRVDNSEVWFTPDEETEVELAGMEALAVREAEV